MSKSSGQLYLGLSEDNLLSIVGFPASPLELPSAVVTGPPFILKLPDELLVSILELAVFVRNFHHDECSECRFVPDTRCAKALSRVCRRFSHIAQPMLFRTLVFQGTPSIVPPKKSAIRLHRALWNNPSLRQHCRRLSISVSDIPEVTRGENFAIAKDLVMWLTRVRCLESYGGFAGEFSKQQTWKLLRKTAQTMGEVQHWRVCREGWGLNLCDIVNESAFSSLTTLGLHGISECKTHAFQPDPNVLRTSPIRSISISDYDETPQATALLLQWPRELEYFNFGSFYSNPWTMSYPMMQSWLSIHKETIKYINLGYLSSNGGPDKHIFDATIFPNLETLRLSRWSMGRPGALLPFDSQNAKVLGPKVQIFGWCFYIYDQHSEGWGDFGDDEEAWVRGLGNAAIARKSALKTIEIEFQPDAWGVTPDHGYPWDRMDRIRDDLLRPNNMDLTYDKLPISREKWLGHEQEVVLEEQSEEWSEERLEDEMELGDETAGLSQRRDTPPGFHGRDIREYFISS